MYGSVYVKQQTNAEQIRIDLEIKHRIIIRTRRVTRLLVIYRILEELKR